MADQNFKLEKTLGEGAFGKVYLVSCKDDPRDKYAMKVINLKKSPQEEREMALAESKLLADIKHEHILQYVKSFEDNGALCIVTEFCDGGDLSEFLEERHGKALAENRIVQWFREICSALEYLHARKTLHRDLKTQNVFLTGRKKTAKLGDLGLAKVLEQPNAKAVTFCGSPYYMSPELFACKPYDHKSDIWSLGVCVYEMATLERPFDATLMQQLVFKIVHGQLPPMPRDKYSTALIELMEKMLDKSSDTRPSATSLLADPIFATTAAPKTPPPPLPKRRTEDLSASRMLKQTCLGGNDEGSKAFDMASLMSTLNGMGSIIRSTAKIQNKFMADSYVDNDSKFDKTVKHVKSFKSTLTTSDVKVDFNSSSNSELGDTLVDRGAGAAANPVQSEPMNPARIMQRVVRTLTAIFPKGSDGDNDGAFNMPLDDSLEMEPEAMLLHQIEQLQQHCARVIGDLNKLRRAYDMLNQVDDDMQLEAKLIKLLSPEVFGACGVQLFYCKTFEYNLEKLKDGGRGTSDA